MPIRIPNTKPLRALARKLFDALISEIPLVGGPYAAMLSVTHPSQADQLIDAWRVEVTECINNHERAIEILLPKLRLSENAAALGCWISRNSVDTRDVVDFAQLQSVFPDATKLELEDACGELELAGMLTLSGAIGCKILDIKPSGLFFEVFDPIVFQVNPRVDAAQLARFILDHDGTVTADEMLKQFQWPHRRFIPAFDIVRSMIADGRKDTKITRTPSCGYVMPDPRERAELRLFANRILGDNA